MKKMNLWDLDKSSFEAGQIGVPRIS